MAKKNKQIPTNFSSCIIPVVRAFKTLKISKMHLRELRNTPFKLLAMTFYKDCFTNDGEEIPRKHNSNIARILACCKEPDTATFEFIPSKVESITANDISVIFGVPNATVDSYDPVPVTFTKKDYEKSIKKYFSVRLIKPKHITDALKDLVSKKGPKEVKEFAVLICALICCCLFFGNGSGQFRRSVLKDLYLKMYTTNWSLEIYNYLVQSMNERSKHKSQGCGGCTLGLLFWFVEIANDFSPKKEDNQKIPRCLRWNFNEISEEFLKLTLPSTNLKISNRLELSEVERQIIRGYIKDVEVEGTKDEDKFDDFEYVDVVVAAAAAAEDGAAANEDDSKAHVVSCEDDSEGLDTSASSEFKEHGTALGVVPSEDDRIDEGETSNLRSGVKRKRNSKEEYVKSLPEKEKKVLKSEWIGRLIFAFYKGAEMGKKAWVSKDFPSAVITAEIFQQVLFSEHIRADFIDWYGNFLERNHIQQDRVIIFTTYVGRCALQKDTSESRTLHSHFIKVLKERFHKNVDCLLFPMNINEVHWILLAFDMKSWDWRLYDSYKTAFSKEDGAYVNTIKDSLYKEIKVVAENNGLTPQNGRLNYVDCTQQNSRSNACPIYVMKFMKDLSLGQDPSSGPLEDNIRVRLLTLVLMDSYNLNLNLNLRRIDELQARILELEATLASTKKLETNQEIWGRTETENARLQAELQSSSATAAAKFAELQTQMETLREENRRLQAELQSSAAVAAKLPELQTEMETQPFHDASVDNMHNSHEDNFHSDIGFHGNSVELSGPADNQMNEHILNDEDSVRNVGTSTEVNLRRDGTDLCTSEDHKRSFEDEEIPGNTVLVKYVTKPDEIDLEAMEEEGLEARRDGTDLCTSEDHKRPFEDEEIPDSTVLVKDVTKPDEIDFNFLRYTQKKMKLMNYPVMIVSVRS